ncbi:MAG: DUF2807 domain-containing protein [Prevotellaceae bacterium]|jgi:hypothetical protein|nr:DUF2807 domain-containing protein [Prevotellaceae bacterium]
MKKITLLLILSGMAFAAAGQLTETRKVSGFTGISASGVFDITVTKGAAESLAITADEDVMPYVRSEVSGGVLKLYIDRNVRRNVRNVKMLKAAVTVKELDMARLSGACRLAGEEVFTPAKFSGDLSGASSLQLTVITGQLSLDVSGACKATLHATVENTVVFDISGATKIQGNLTANKLTVDMSGASRLDLTGAADDASFDISGITSIHAKDFTLKNASVESSGASSVDLHVTESLRVHLSGASVVRYKGNPSTFDVETSGAAGLKKIK